MLVVLFAVGSISARAHEETALDALSIIDRVEPEVMGVAFRAVHVGQPLLIAVNRTPRALVIFGRSSEPFLRLQDGRIETNLHSPLTYTTRSPIVDDTALPEGIDVDAAPVWDGIAHGRSWSWFDPRIHGPRAGDMWTIDARLGDTNITIEGSFEQLGRHGHFVSKLDSPPIVDGLKIELTDGLVPAFFVRNETDRSLRVTGRQGEPFLKIGPRGVVANLESPDYYLGGNQTLRRVPRGADPDDPPRWRRLSRLPIWTWLEFRARLPASAHYRQHLGRERHPVLSWETPMTLGGSPLHIRGVVEWVPPRPDEPAPRADRAPTALLLAAVAGLLVVLIARKRRRLEVA